MKAVIMAGGKGTRIATMNAVVPKPMINICGKPILEYQIDCLRKQNITDKNISKLISKIISPLINKKSSTSKSFK